jgi:hypothetical protein
MGVSSLTNGMAMQCFLQKDSVLLLFAEIGQACQLHTKQVILDDSIGNLWLDLPEQIEKDPRLLALFKAS